MQTRKRRHLSISLFPFMDVLTGAIAILLLIICSLAILGLNKSTVVVDLSTGTDGKCPVFLDCREDSVVLMGEEFEEPETLQFGVDRDAALQALFARLHPLSSSHRFVLNVRPSGVDTYRDIQFYFRENKFTYGYEPTPANQTIKFKRR